MPLDVANRYSRIFEKSAQHRFSTMSVKRLKTYSNFEDLKSWLNKVERKTDVITTDLSSQLQCISFLEESLCFAACVFQAYDIFWLD